ncbi:IS5 family transposase [Isosphaeraceae bacterium EP7]
MITHRKPYDTDISDAEWVFVAPYLTLLPEHSGPRRHDLREVLNALRWMIRSGSPRRLIPHDLPPWHAVYDQARRWLDVGCFEAIVLDLRVLLRLVGGRDADPGAAIIDSRTVQSTPESGARAGYDGYKRRKGSKVHMAVDTLGHLLALHVTPASEQDRAQVGVLCEAMHKANGESVELIYADQVYTGEETFDEAAGHKIILEVVKLPEAKKGFVLLPRRWVVERSFGWMARFRRLARDYERLATTLAGWHCVAFSLLMLHSAAPVFAVWSP